MQLKQNAHNVEHARSQVPPSQAAAQRIINDKVKEKEGDRSIEGDRPVMGCSDQQRQ